MGSIRIGSSGGDVSCLQRYREGGAWAAIWHLIVHNQAFFLAFIWLFFYIGVRLWPASFWLEVDRVTVFDGHAGEEIIMEVDRSIHWSFYGEWTVLIREVTQAGSEIVCVARGSGDYTPTAVLPAPLTLSWWTEGECPYLSSGYYYLTTIWEIDGGWLPNKVIEEQSNVFFVTERGQESNARFHDFSRQDPYQLFASMN